ncbi:uncharacterized protein LOC116110328 [Pistacia vera]|uniref:uncharacterized protein LOC116110328 n=1 Tax=Pistacia vera TaxID=55513 RepID=UPI0012633494|nr:uncharacterized protein LOC116110328 [Pistacia vera]
MEPLQAQGRKLPSTEPRMKRYKPIWRFLLISNFALGGYIFAKARQKHQIGQDKKAAKPSEEEEGKAAVEISSSQIYDESLILPPVIEPVKVREPIPEDQQCELFKWMLEEKRKVKPKDREDKQQIDEEKGILKQFIRPKSISQL